MGWNVIAVFDPDVQRVRVRSYRIDDVDNYAEPPVDYLHEGPPAPTECFETDQDGLPERVLAWDFSVASAAQAPSLSPGWMGGLALVLAVGALWAVRRSRQ